MPASSSVIRRANEKQPYSVEDRADSPVSLYAATRRAGELIAESYCRSYGMSAIRVSLLYGVRTLGPPRHGALSVHRRNPRRPADQCFQQRRDEPRLHL